jgi:hypothetical protein
MPTMLGMFPHDVGAESTRECCRINARMLPRFQTLMLRSALLLRPTVRRNCVRSLRALTRAAAQGAARYDMHSNVTTSPAVPRVRSIRRAPLLP